MIAPEFPALKVVSNRVQVVFRCPPHYPGERPTDYWIGYFPDWQFVSLL